MYLQAEDKVAYIIEGKDYGLIGLSSATSYDYNFYLDYIRRYKEYIDKLNAYNADAKAYALALGGRTVLAEPEYSRLKQWYDNLQYQVAIINNMYLMLGKSYYKTFGIVSKIEVFW